MESGFMGLPLSTAVTVIGVPAVVILLLYLWGIMFPRIEETAADAGNTGGDDER